MKKKSGMFKLEPDKFSIHMTLTHSVMRLETGD